MKVRKLTAGILSAAILCGYAEIPYLAVGATAFAESQDETAASENSLQEEELTVEDAVQTDVSTQDPAITEDIPNDNEEQTDKSFFSTKPYASCYDFDIKTGQLTLKGNVIADELPKRNRAEIKSIKAEKGTVLPENCNGLFSNCDECKEIDLSNVDTSNVTNMSYMFFNCRSLTSLDLSSFDTSSVTDMTGMFFNCCSLVSLDLSSFDTSSVTNMLDMFCYCTSLVSLDLSSFDASGVTNMAEMFARCNSLTAIDLSNFGTNNVKDMSYMFYECDSLISIDLSNFNFNSGNEYNDLFEDCISLREISLSDSFKQITINYNNYEYDNSKWINKNDPEYIADVESSSIVINNSGTNTYIKLNESDISDDKITNMQTSITTTTETTTTTTETTNTQSTTSDETTITQSMFAPISQLGDLAENDYSSINGINPADSVTKDNRDGTYSIELMDEKGNVIDVYTIDPESGKGTNSKNETVDLPQTGNNSLKTVISICIAISFLLFGIYAMKKSFKPTDNEN